MEKTPFLFVFSAPFDAGAAEEKIKLRFIVIERRMRTETDYLILSMWNFNFKTYKWPTPEPCRDSSNRFGKLQPFLSFLLYK